ncbi:phage integrase family protein [Rubellimicrobium mesophilum DSM 19309]|uniref:Phage integrase family protein n=1 Tax=Rubellimicrobium mesophilum DSM 19309 TaxID=442562 RepID=A0A017HBD1_9RHOB|nr:tyrosine-type recombinase/integrase [Rubellimicrobium mesophilum]EYD71605.1 phage integrase family protein [Rubellimicrobium mesophilum DSM 19309]
MKRKRQFPGATPYTDRHGTRRWRYRKHGKSFELGTSYGSEEFVRRYGEAVKGAKPAGRIGADRTTPGTIADLVARLLDNLTARKDLASSTKANYCGIYERFREEHGWRRVAGLDAHAVERLIAKKTETPAAANNFRKRLSQLLDLAVSLKWLPANPVRETKSLPMPGTGLHTWSEAEIARFFEVHKPGTLPHMAVTLMLYTAAAKVDAVKLGWFSIKETFEGRRIEYRRQKTRRGDAPLVSIPIHDDLAAVLAVWPKECGTFLETAFGKPRSAAGLGNDMREWCDAAGLPVCTSHGLRKAMARRLAEQGATAPQIMAVTGHKTLSEVQRYIAEASRPKMAGDAMALLARPMGGNNVANLAERFATNRDKP